MTEIVPWHELTPMAQYAMRIELSEMLECAPNQEVVPMIRQRVQLDPRVIPYMVADMRRRIAEAKIELEQ